MDNLIESGFLESRKDVPRCYIAGKIGSLPEQEYEANFNQAKEEVAAMGFITVSPIDLSHNHARTWSDYMKEDIRALTECEYVYALRNWRQSPGATIEVNLAVQIGINVIFQK